MGDFLYRVERLRTAVREFIWRTFIVLLGLTLLFIVYVVESTSEQLTERLTEREKNQKQRRENTGAGLAGDGLGLFRIGLIGDKIWRVEW